MTEPPRPPIAPPVAPPPTRATVRVPTPPTPQPDDITPLHTPLPDHSWFPCPHCARMIQCPPAARPVTTQALARAVPIVNPPAPKSRLVAPELEPGPHERQELTRIMPAPPIGGPPGAQPQARPDRPAPPIGDPSGAQSGVPSTGRPP